MFECKVFCKDFCIDQHPAMGEYNNILITFFFQFFL